MNESETPAQLEAEIPLGLAGARVDQALAQLFPDYSRSRLSAWLKAGRVLVDGEVLRQRDPVRGGERVTLRVIEDTQVHAAAEAIALDILYEDASVLVVNKPPGLVVHPGAGNPAGTLQNALLHHDPKLARVPRAGLVHRLDKETSGALVVARTLAAHTRLVAQLAERDVHRQYEAVVYGTMVAGGTVDAPIGRHPRERLRMAVVEGGRPAITHYRVRDRYRAHTLLQVKLETGRTHQIRVHLAHIRHPLVGDTLYGGGLKLPRGATPALAEALRAFRRQALHAEKLEFEHPSGRKLVSVEAPRPADLERLLAALAEDRAAHAAGARA
ncbi:MAG: 23S rRNA pseudouridine(1911/1915/1917) synthase RluD [Delftia acidovorans]|nr:23S rRNA pseudouridine(1911/1915/1917) synthase RluD [Delftia acidovorans]MBP6691751.1 23S rRNA pseudouridine(1911/1915/1917) synthase RluD [Xanthomonadales bacterium]HQW64043.1 23S rRNA pseudouridine(1911/1915/1917) synthase RluD [Pseudomonadota bacterium]MBP7417734.1 23S rRNA pseudouridine(1911/1915/1917) synthase RluD [Xanthomonadales bacterium]MBP8177696.1 23S rRNA pseudouridine(1911/1915/1917) synthase RluD [Xanthomonadales bacterium]